MPNPNPTTGQPVSQLPDREERGPVPRGDGANEVYAMEEAADYERLCAKYDTGFMECICDMPPEDGFCHCGVALHPTQSNSQ